MNIKDKDSVTVQNYFFKNKIHHANEQSKDSSPDPLLTEHMHACFIKQAE
jgi:hypothetical protein